MQKFLTGKQGLHPEGLTSERTVFTLVILLQREKRKLRNRVMSLVRTERLINSQADNDEWAIKVKGRLTFVNDLRAEDAVYRIQFS